MFIPGRICFGCKTEILKGHDVVGICDKVTKGFHHFHMKCAPTREEQPDVQRHFGVNLEPIVFDFKPKDI